MSVSKRLRYEVLRRDDYACRYCGIRASDSPLTIDHVVPSALGGTDEPSNLVTCCRDCNAGKSSSSPDAAIVAGVTDEDLRWGRAMREAAEVQAQKRDECAAYVAAFEERWNAWGPADAEGNKTSDVPLPKPHDWKTSIGQLHNAGLEVDVVVDLVDVAMQANPRDRFRFFMGCCWRVIHERQQIARELLEAED